MGKHKHSKDRMFITYSEHKSDWGVTLIYLQLHLILITLIG